MRKTYFLFIAAVAAVVFGVSCKTAPAAAPAEEAGASQYRDSSGPELRVTFSPQYFSPDGDREELIMFLFAVDESPVGKWRVEIREPQPPHAVFREWEGEGAPPESLRWNGKSLSGELVQSATDYPFMFTAEDVHGNSGTVESFVEVDVIVIREGDNLRMQIPSIVFSSYSDRWDGLGDDIVETNDWVLRRVAYILGKFGDYKVYVEGHANSTIDPLDAAGRQREQTLELQPLSERRAKAIVNELILLGIDAARLSSYGLGGAQPIISWQDKDNWWKNRRVEFILIK